MKAKEKAKELLFKKFGCKKQYSLIAVDEIMGTIDAEDQVILYNYWQEVKQEIEKL